MLPCYASEIEPLQESELSSPYEAQSEGENENERLLFFSDGIIAFTITLATISIRLPSDKPIAELPTLLTDLYPNLIGLAVLTFILSTPIDILAYFWVSLLVEFVVFVIHRVRHLLQHRKLSI